MFQRRVNVKSKPFVVVSFRALNIHTDVNLISFVLFVTLFINACIKAK